MSRSIDRDGRSHGHKTQNQCLALTSSRKCAPKHKESQQDDDDDEKRGKGWSVRTILCLVRMRQLLLRFPHVCRCVFAVVPIGRTSLRRVEEESGGLLIPAAVVVVVLVVVGQQARPKQHSTRHNERRQRRDVSIFPQRKETNGHSLEGF